MGFKKKVLIGAFVIGFFLTLGLVFTMLNAGLFTKSTSSFVLYFQSSVRGLVTGAPVYFNGVRVGEVVSMNITPHVDGFTFSTPVVIALEDDKKSFDGTGNTGEIGFAQAMENEKYAKKLIQQGLRAKLGTSSYITGQLIVELEIAKDAPDIPISSLKEFNGLLEIPTISTPFETFIESVREIPIDEITHTLLTTLQNINTAVESANIGEITQSLNETLTSMQPALESVSKIQEHASELIKSGNTTINIVNANLETLLSRLDTALVNLNGMAEQGDITLSRVENILQGDSATMQEFSTTMTAIREAAHYIAIFARLLEQDPNALIFGTER